LGDHAAVHTCVAGIVGSTRASRRPDELTTTRAIEICDRSLRGVRVGSCSRAARNRGAQGLNVSARLTLLEAGIRVWAPDQRDGLLINACADASELKMRFHVGVSVDGVPADHDRIRNLPGSFVRLWRVPRR